jgi:hypothetical protein
VPKGAGAGTTTITWSVPQGVAATIRVSMDGMREVLFAEGGASGAAKAPFIVSGNSYAFKLYASTAPGKAVATVVVRRP